jgi:hypothetical protein
MNTLVCLLMKLLELENQEGESVGIANGTETWEAVIGNQQRIMSKYLASWEHWLASGGPKAYFFINGNNLESSPET